MTARKLRSFLFVSALAIGIAAAPSTASAWAPAASAAVHPGVQTITNGGQCTANFVFQDGTNVYIGQAAHCSSTGGQTDTNGCTSDSLPLGTAVEITGATKPGSLVYNSWLTMHANGEANDETCQYNDLALVKLDPADVPLVNPSVPGFGGPTGVGGVGGLGSTVYTFGNSSLRAGITKLGPKQGIVAQNSPGGWSHVVYTVSPGIPGDSGSGFLNGSGQAIGILSTLNILPLPAANGVGDLSKEIAYMHAHSSFTGVNLVPGTQAFKANLLQAILGA